MNVSEGVYTTPSSLSPPTPPPCVPPFPSPVSSLFCLYTVFPPSLQLPVAQCSTMESFVPLRRHPLRLLQWRISPPEVALPACHWSSGSDVGTCKRACKEKQPEQTKMQRGRECVCVRVCEREREREREREAERIRIGRFYFLLPVLVPQSKHRDDHESENGGCDTDANLQKKLKIKESEFCCCLVYFRWCRITPLAPNIFELQCRCASVNHIIPPVHS